MRRLLIAALVVLCATTAATTAATATAATTAAAPTQADPSLAQLRGFVCQPAVSPAQREVFVQAVMRPLAGTVKMTMRFELLRRVKGQAAFSDVGGPDLGNWISPQNPTLGQRPADVWIVDHPVVGLTAPAVYRLRVTFRWLGAGGTVLGNQRVLSGRCNQPELAPDLLVQSITVVPIVGAALLEQYVAQIVNDGGTAAGPFTVQFSDGGVVESKPVALLRARRSRLVSFSGPLCSAATDPTVTVDPAGQVVDLNPANNALAATCPASTPSLYSLKR